MANVTSFPLEGDGLVQNLFYYMWMKDELDCGIHNVSIPDTVVYKYRQPCFWFFTSKDGSIKKKNRANISNAKIEVRVASRRHFQTIDVCEVASRLAASARCSPS
jgi:hypothetical protein